MCALSILHFLCVTITFAHALLTFVGVLLTVSNVIMHECLMGFFKHHFKIFKVCKEIFDCRDSNSETRAFLALYSIRPPSRRKCKSFKDVQYNKYIHIIICIQRLFVYLCRDI